jgi:hypothetical protein
MNGVGVKVSHNKMYDTPHNVILFGGNDHVMEYNLIYNAVTETGDAGAIYAGRDWTLVSAVAPPNASWLTPCHAREAISFDITSFMTSTGRVLSAQWPFIWMIR